MFNNTKGVRCKIVVLAVGIFGNDTMRILGV